MKENETWKDVPGYEGLYQASTMGRIRSLDREIECKDGRFKIYRGKIKEIGIQGNNRPYVQLSKDGKRKNYKVYKLIALTFIGPRPEGYDVCHINDDCWDNRLSNLKYDTRSQNLIDKYRNGNKASCGKLSIFEVCCIRSLYNTGRYSHIRLGRMFNVAHNTIGDIIRKETFSWVQDNGTIDESDTKVS